MDHFLQFGFFRPSFSCFFVFDDKLFCSWKLVGVSEIRYARIGASEHRAIRLSTSGMCKRHCPSTSHSVDMTMV